MAAHPLDDVANTDWGQQQERRHRENLDRFDNLGKQLKLYYDTDQKEHADLERRLDVSDAERRSLRTEVGENTELTKKIKADTATIVGLTRAARSVRIFLAWAIPIICTLITAYVTWTVKK